MKNSLSKSQIERFSRQLVLKNIGAKGQKKILSSSILIVGVGGLGCPAAENLVRAGIGTIGLIDNDIINNNDRIAQMVLTPIIKMELEETNELPESIRDKGGFGSTGK